jgi:hypothetical protein
MYKFTGSSSLSAAIGNGDNALRKVQRSLQFVRGQPTVTANTLYSEHGWPTYESPISAARCVLDMLLQSWGKHIRIFPACPAEWRDAGFHDLRAEGAFLVSAKRKDGRTQFIRVKSLAGEPCMIKCDLPEPLKCIGPSTINLRRNNGVIQLNLQKDEEAILYSGAKLPDLTVSPLPVESEQMNAWGAKSQDFSKRSKQALSDKIYGQRVLIRWKELDKYKRTPGHIYLGDRWINRAMANIAADDPDV